jgi:hypothetical protein
VCSSPQKISAAEQRNDVLPLLTAVAGLAMRAVGGAEFSAITFMDNHLAAQGRSLQLPAARAAQLYASLDDGTVNADAFRANVAKEFTEKSDPTETDAVQDSPIVAMLPRARPAQEEKDRDDVVPEAPVITMLPRPRPAIEAMQGDHAVPEATVIAMLPRPRPRIEPEPDHPVEADVPHEWNTAGYVRSGAVELPALSDVPLPRRRPKPNRAKPKDPVAQTQVPQAQAPEAPASQLF